MKIKLLAVVLVALVALSLPGIALASGPLAAEAPDLLSQLFAQLPGLIGFAALFTAIINIAKLPGWVTPENEPNVQAVLSFVLLAALLAGHFFGFNVAGFDAKAAYLATVIGAVVQFLVQFGLIKAAHATLRGVGYIGASYSFKAENPTALGMPTTKYLAGVSMVGSKKNG